jgi:hypothetical protein
VRSGDLISHPCEGSIHISHILAKDLHRLSLGGIYIVLGAYLCDGLHE